MESSITFLTRKTLNKEIPPIETETTLLKKRAIKVLQEDGNSFIAPNNHTCGVKLFISNTITAHKKRVATTE